MTESTLDALKDAVREKTIWSLADYYNISYSFLTFINSTNLTRIVSPFRQNSHYIFYQHGPDAHNRITRPLNTNLFIESPLDFKNTFESVIAFLADLKLRPDMLVNERLREQISDFQSFLTKDLWVFSR